MSYRSYLSRSRTGSFHFRLRLCSITSGVLGLREIRRGLGTRDRLEAQRRALDLYQAVLALQRDPSGVPALLQKRVREKASQSPQKALGTSNKLQGGVATISRQSSARTRHRIVFQAIHRADTPSPMADDQMAHVNAIHASAQAVAAASATTRTGGTRP